MTVKSEALVPVPSAVVTLSLPVVAPSGTRVRIVLSSTTVKTTALLPLKSTRVAPLKRLPRIVTGVATIPMDGVNWERSHPGD